MSGIHQLISGKRKITFYVILFFFLTAQGYSQEVNQNSLTTQNTQIISEYSINEISHYYGGASFTNEFLIDDNYAYIANGYDGLSIVDITNQSDLVQVSSIQTGFHAFHVEKFGDLVLIENGDKIITQHDGGGVSIFNVSDPYSPVLIYEDHTISASSFEIFNNYLLIGSFSDQIDIYNMQSGQLVFQSNFNVINFATSMTIIGNYVYTTEYVTDSSVYDLSDINQVSRTFQFNESYSSIIPVGDILYAWGNNGTNIFSMFNITNTAIPQLIETQSIINVPQIAKVGNIIHAIEPSQGYFTINVTDPLNPVYTAKQSSLQSGEIEMVGDIGLVIQSTSLTSYNMSNPTSLIILDSISYSRLEFNYLYQFGQYNLATAGDNLFVFDRYGNLVNQITSSSLGIGSVSMYAMISVGDILYIKGPHPIGLIVVNMADVFNPIYLGGINFNGLEGGFEVIGNTLFFGNNYGLYSFNITDPTDPVQIQYLDLIGVSINDIFAVGNQIVIDSGTSSNNYIFDVSDPYDMTILNTLGDRVTDLYVENDIFMIAVSDGIEVYQYNEGQAPTFLRFIFINNIGEVEPIGGLFLNNWGNTFDLLNFSLTDTAIDVVNTFSISTRFGETQDYVVRDNILTIATDLEGIYTYELVETIREVTTETMTVTETAPVTTQIEEVTVTLTQNPDQTVTDTVTFTEGITTTQTVTVTEGSGQEITDEPTTEVSRANVQNVFPFAIVVVLIIQKRRNKK